MKNDEFAYIDENKKQTKKPSTLIVIAIVLVIVATLVFFAFKNGKIFGIKIPWIKTQEEKELERYEQELEDQYKTYDRESKLIVPSINTVDSYKIHDKDVKAKVNNFTASKDGYKIELKIINEHDSNINYKCTKVLIDGFETDATFEVNLETGSSKDIDVTIKKTELDFLEINDLNRLSFLGNITLIKDNEQITTKSTFDVNFIQLTSVNNAKQKLRTLDQNDFMTISYYKTISDKDYTYIYFDIKNNSSTTNFDLTVNKLFVNEQLYDIEDLKVSSHYYGEKIFAIEISKKDIKQVDKIAISFTLVSNSERGGKDIYITSQSTIDLT